MLMTPWVQRLLLANVVVYLLTSFNPGLRADFAFIPMLALFRPWTLVTYAFLHANLAHIFFNLLMLFFFGPRLEERLGSRTFIWFYVLCGVGGRAPFLRILANRRGRRRVRRRVWGGAGIRPLLAARGDLHLGGASPSRRACSRSSWWRRAFSRAWRAPRTGSRTPPTWGGLATGWLFLRAWERRRHRRVVVRTPPTRVAPEVTDADALTRWDAIPRDRLHEINREEVDSLLQKVRKAGPRALTPDERAFLDRMAKTF